MTSATRASLATALRRVALPLGCYYAVAIALPLANGAAQSGAAFVDHALIVLIVPLLLIVLVCGIHSVVQVIASACRSALLLAQSTRSGQRAAN